MACLANKVRAYLADNDYVVDFSERKVVVEAVGDVENIVHWNIEGIDQPTNEQLELYHEEAEKYEYNRGVIQKRKELYGKWGDQLDEMFHDFDAWKARIQKIKDDNPKQ